MATANLAARKEIRAGPGSGSPVSQDSLTPGLRGSFPSRDQSLGDSCSRTPSILPPSTNLSSSVPAYGITHLGLRSYPSGSFVPETPSTSFFRPDRPVYATASIRSTGPCQPSMALAGPTFSYLRNPYPHFSGGFHDFYRRFHSRVGRSHGGFADFGYLDPCKPQAPYQLYKLQAPYQLSGVQGGSLCPTALGSIAPGPPGYDRYGQFDNSFVYQQARRDPFPHLATFDSRASPLVRGSDSPSKTYSRLSERDSRPPISSESANTDRVESPPRDREPHLRVLGNPSSRHVRDCVEFPPSLVHVSNSGATSPSGGYSVSGLAGEVNVHVSSIPSAQQSHSEAPVHPGGRSNSHSPLVAETCSRLFRTSFVFVWTTPCSFPTVEIFCPSRIRSMSQTESLLHLMGCRARV